MCLMHLSIVLVFKCCVDVCLGRACVQSLPVNWGTVFVYYLYLCFLYKRWLAFDNLSSLRFAGIQECQPLVILVSFLGFSFFMPLVVFRFLDVYVLLDHVAFWFCAYSGSCLRGFLERFTAVELCLLELGSSDHTVERVNLHSISIWHFEYFYDMTGMV